MQFIFTSSEAICIVILFFAGYYQPTLYSDEDEEGYAMAEEKRPSKLSDDVRERLKSDLLTLFEEKKRFQSPTLSIDDVAKDLGSNRTYVSRIINEEFGSNFYAFVNGYRMKEFMSRLHNSKDGASFKIKEVSGQVGFKSYSSFFSYFREEMGTTPSDYLRHRQKTDYNAKE
jgi:AraC-like DNA-binding protein